MKRILRDKPVSQARAHVAHVFDDSDYWWPYRSSLCGREFLGEQLITSMSNSVRLCVQCQRHQAEVA